MTSERGFAIFDSETTGLSGADRIIEIAIVHADENGRITGRWDTLINPNRSPGATSIHRITARDLVNAPTFTSIAPQLVEFFSGRVLVGHNLPFDFRFLRSEFARLGYAIPEEAPRICTMKMSRKYRKGEKSHKLQDCCKHFGVPLEDAHRASADTEATALLLEQYIAHNPDDPTWSQSLDAAEGASWEPLGWDPLDFYARQDVAA